MRLTYLLFVVYSVLITTAVSSKITPEDVKKASTDGYSSLRTGLTEIQKTGASYAPVAMDAAGKVYISYRLEPSCIPWLLSLTVIRLSLGYKRIRSQLLVLQWVRLLSVPLV